MHEYILKDVVTIEDYNKYCHYVAGLVGIGLSQLFASSGLEAEEIGTQVRVW
jgi:farnesyl-diphosphate farnesyltransferase